jgi:hypothetical protein
VGIAVPSDVKVRVVCQYVALAVGSALFLWPFVRVLWRVGDEGVFVYGAVRVFDGEVPSRDFFEVIGPGSFYWLALFFKLFGISWVTTRLALVVTAVATTLVLYWLTRRLNSRHGILSVLILLVLGVPLWPAISQHVDSNLFALLSFGALLIWHETGRRAALTVSGMLGGLTTCFMQQKGLVLVGSYLLVLWIRRRDKGDFTGAVGCLFAGYAGIVLPVILAFALAGAGGDLLYANVVWPLSQYHTVNSLPYAYALWELMVPNWMALLRLVSPPWAAAIIGALLVMPFVLVMSLPVVLGVLAFWRRHASVTSVPCPYWIVGFALWVSEIHRKDIQHLIWGSPVLMLLCVHLWQERSDVISRVVSRVVVLGTVLVALLYLTIASAAQTRVETRRGAVYTFKKDDALAFLNTNTEIGEEVFVYPYYSMYYFLSGTRNATRFSILMYQINTEAQFKEAVHDIDRKAVRYVLWDTLVTGKNLQYWFPSYRQPPEQELVVEPYLKERYDVIGYRNDFRILRRRPTGPG